MQALAAGNWSKANTRSTSGLMRPLAIPDKL
jgi:hypothetical protein